MEKEKLISKSDIKFIVLILFSSIAVLNVIFGKGYINGHDTDFHMASINSIAQTIWDGNWFFPKVLPGLGFDMNYGTSLFYAPLSHDVSACFYLLLSKLGVGLETCIKYIHLTSLFISGISMFYFIKRVTGNKWSSMISSVVYISFTYRLSLIIIRDAIAESFVYMFLPLVFWGLFELRQGNRWRFFFLVTIGASGIILSHTLTTIYVAIFCALFAAFNYKMIVKWENVKCILLAGLFIFAITAYYTIPLVIQKNAANYNVFNPMVMGGYTSYVNDSRLTINNIFAIGKTPDITNAPGVYKVVFGISIPLWFMVSYSLFYVKRLNRIDETKVFAVYSLIISLGLLYMTTVYFDWAYVPGFLKMVQFPWRLLGFVGFFFSIISGLFLFLFDKRYEKLITILIYVIVMTIAVNSFNYVELNKTKYSGESELLKLYSNLNTMGYQHEYLTEESAKNIGYLAARGLDVKANNNEAVISNYYRKTPEIMFDVTNNDNKVTEFELPVLYYKGYKAQFTDKNNVSRNVNVEMNDKGLCKIQITGNGNVKIRFTGSNLMITSYYLTINSTLLFVGMLAYITCKKKFGISILNCQT